MYIRTSLCVLRTNHKTKLTFMPVCISLYLLNVTNDENEKRKKIRRLLPTIVKVLAVQVK